MSTLGIVASCAGIAVVAGALIYLIFKHVANTPDEYDTTMKK